MYRPGPSRAWCLRSALVRDTKDKTGPVLSFTARDWQRFTDWLKAGAHSG